MVTFLFALFIVVAIINILFYIGYFSFATSTPTIPKEKLKPVSVLVCAKNEAENLRNFIPSILNQDFANFELILINDASSDDTLEIMEEFQEMDPRVRVVNVHNNEAFWGKKKYALTLGIKKAKYPFLLFTDADCAPETNEWISRMAANFQPGISIVLGYGGYFKNKSSLLNKLIRFETLFTAIQYFSYAKLGTPYMGVGRNLGYTSEEFYIQNGFARHMHIVRSGDDDLFVNSAATKKNTALCYDQQAITRSVPQSSLKSWFRQKRRHISTAGLYKKEHQLLLGSFFFSQFAFWILFLFLIVFQVHWEILLVIFTLRLLLQYFVTFKAAEKLDELDVVWLVPFFDLFLVCTQFGIFIANVFSKPGNWK